MREPALFEFSAGRNIEVNVSSTFEFPVNAHVPLDFTYDISDQIRDVAPPT